MEEHVEEAESKSLEAVGQRRAGEGVLVGGRHKLLVLLHLDLGAYKVPSYEEAVREDLQERRSLLQCRLLLVLGQRLAPEPLGPGAVVEVEGEPDEPERHDAVRHCPANVVAFALSEVVANEEIPEVEYEGDDDTGESSTRSEEDQVSCSDGVDGMF